MGCQFSPAGASDDAVTEDALELRDSPDRPGGPWLTGWTYRKPIRITRAGTTTLTNFPVGILETADVALGLHALPVGTDIVVTAADAVTRLDSELVSFTPSGALELWTRVPSRPPHHEEFPVAG